MLYKVTTFAAQLVIITINNTQSTSTSLWFWSAISPINAHPYVFYTIIGVIAGGFAYYVDWPLFLSSLGNSLS